MKKKQITIGACLLLMVLGGKAVYAQDVETNIAQQYSNENAVITNNTERLVIKADDDGLKAKSYVTEERQLISDVSPGMYNTQTIYHSYFSILDDFEGVSLIPDKNGYKKISSTGSKTTASERENVFYDDAKQTEISFTGLIPGARTRVDYTIKHRDLHFLPVFYVQNYLPTVKSKLEITVPKFVHLKFVIKGNHQDILKQTTKETDNDVTYTWVAKDIKALKSYDDAPSSSYYALQIIPFIADYQLPGSSEKRHVLENPDDLYNYYYNFIKDVNKNDDEILDKTVQEITKGDVTPRQKAKHIYEWVQKNMHYIAFEDKLSGFIPREAADICKKKYGDCKDMTSIQVAMYRKAGIDAYFTWIGTRDKPYTYEETPLPMADNHMICTIKLGNEWIFADGTDPLGPFGTPPYGLQGKEALVGIDANTYKIIKVPEIPADKNVVTDSTTIHVSDRDITGKVSVHYKGYGAWNIAILMMYRDGNEQEKGVSSIVSRGSNKFIQKSYSYKLDDDSNKNVSLSSDFEIKDYVSNVSNEYYVNMNLLRSYEDEYANEKEREVPIEHNYKNRIKQVVILEIPKGYHVSYLPPNAEKKVDGLWSYKISYTKTAKEVVLVKEYELQTLYVQPGQFAAENKLVEDLKKQYKESVVLTAN
jgi:transglutaminase-like putative cysteine protease